MISASLAEGFWEEQTIDRGLEKQKESGRWESLEAHGGQGTAEAES